MPPLERKISRRDFVKRAGVGLVGLALSPYGGRSEIPEATPDSLAASPLIHASEKLEAKRVPYIQHGDLQSKQVAITIDDGWYPELVTKMLDTLTSVNLEASLFAVGAVFKESPDLWRKASLKHEILNHTYSHPVDLDRAEKSRIVYQLKRWEEEYARLNLGEYTKKVMRPPGLSGTNNQNLYYACMDLGYKGVYGCTVPSRGVLGGSKDEVIKQMSDAKGGSILLFHFVEADIAAMPAVIQGLRDRGLEPCKLSKLPGNPLYQK